MVRKINPHLYSIKIRLPGSPLRDLNSYVIVTPNRNLLIDTGFNMPGCMNDMLRGIKELDLDMSRTDFLITHAHADHFGLVNKLAEPECQVFIGEMDVSLLRKEWGDGTYWLKVMAQFVKEGFPAGLIKNALDMNPARALAGARPASLTPLKDGQLLTVGDIQLRCVHTPGHSPGHICLYNEIDKYMILGDHVLFDITPNITTWPNMRNSLGKYLNSLRETMNYDVCLPLPAHRECHCTLAERISQLLAHHDKRLNEIVEIIRKNPGSNAYDIAGNMEWLIKAKSWEYFPLAQKWFAIGEALAHLYYLQEESVIRSEMAGDTVVYFA